VEDAALRRHDSKIPASETLVREHSPVPLDGWADFYLIVGSGGAALTGLMFIVITLAADRHAGTEGTNAAYGTPTVLHLFVVLLISAYLMIPGQSARTVAFGLAAFGVWGLGYLGVVVARMRRHHAYEPVPEDWVWHVGVPSLAYAGLLAASFVALGRPATSLYLVAGCIGLLLATGMHNAWDAATYIATKPSND
jgi:hypothetical protein